MKAFILSDIHVDTWFENVVDRKRWKVPTPDKDVVPETMDWLWKFREYPVTDALIVAGDIANDYQSYVQAVEWLSKKYKKVYICVGNHDILVRHATPYASNAKFALSENKLDAILMQDLKYDNVHIIEGRQVDGIAGCMGMCDLKCDAMPGFDYRTAWRRSWFDGRNWRYMNQEPGKIWNYYDAMLTGLCKAAPKIVMTHFAPFQVGVNWKYRNNRGNVFFYYRGEKYLDLLPDGTTWICGHIHDQKICDWVNSSGAHIRILCNPSGYPGEGRSEADTVKVVNGKIERDIVTTTHEDFIIDI